MVNVLLASARGAAKRAFGKHLKLGPSSDVIAGLGVGKGPRHALGPKGAELFRDKLELRHVPSVHIAQRGQARPCSAVGSRASQTTGIRTGSKY